MKQCRAARAGRNPMVIKKGIDKAAEFVITKLKERAIPIRNMQDVKQGPLPLPCPASPLGCAGQQASLSVSGLI